jgi:hypothetical protein
MEPILFATIGTSIVFSKLAPGTIPLSLLVVCTGQCAERPWSSRLRTVQVLTCRTANSNSCHLALVVMVRTAVVSTCADWSTHCWCDAVLPRRLCRLVCARHNNLLHHGNAPLHMEGKAVLRSRVDAQGHSAGIPVSSAACPHQPDHAGQPRL